MTRTGDFPIFLTVENGGLDLGENTDFASAVIRGLCAMHLNVEKNICIQKDINCFYVVC